MNKYQRVYLSLKNSKKRGTRPKKIDSMISNHQLYNSYATIETGSCHQICTAFRGQANKVHYEQKLAN